MEGHQRTLMEKIKALQEDANRLKTEFTFNDMETLSWLNMPQDNNNSNNEEEDEDNNNRVYKIDQNNNRTTGDLDTTVEDWKDPLFGSNMHRYEFSEPHAKESLVEPQDPQVPENDESPCIVPDWNLRQQMAELQVENQELQKKTKDMNQLIHLYDELKSMYAALKRSFESSETIRLEQKRLIDTLNEQHSGVRKSTCERRAVHNNVMTSPPLLVNMEESMAESADILLGRISTRLRECPSRDEPHLAVPEPRPHRKAIPDERDTKKYPVPSRVVLKKKSKTDSMHSTSRVSMKSLKAKKSQKERLERLTRGTAASRSRISAIQNASLR